MKILIEVELNTEDEDEVIGVKESIANLVEPWQDVTKPVKVTIIDPNKEQSEIEGLFNEFWTHYPRKVGKVNAFKSFKKVCKDRKMLETIIAALEKHKKTAQWKDVQYIPHPAVWLNGHRWEDELDGQIEIAGASTASYDLEKLKHEGAYGELNYFKNKEKRMKQKNDRAC